MSVYNRPDLRTTVKTPTEARDALEAAETLGLELREVAVYGWWEGRDGAEPSSGSTWSLQRKTRNARKWFYLAGNGYQPFAARPIRATVDGADDGTLELRFDKVVA